MSPSHERTLKLLQTLDEELYRFHMGDQSGHKRITGTIRWINENLNHTAIFELIDSVYLTYGSTIKALLDDETFDPRTNA